MDIDVNSVAFFIQDLRGGGAERSTVRLVNGIVRRSLRVDLVLVNRTGPFLKELDSRVNVVTLPQGRTITAISGLRSYIKSSRPAVLISSMTHTNVAAIIACLGLRCRPRLIVVEHNSFERNRAAKSGLERLAYTVAPWMFHFADTVAVVAEGMRDDLCKIISVRPEAVKVLYNPVVTAELFEMAGAAPSHPWLVEKNVPVFLAVGRLVPQKNFALLIEAFAGVREIRPARLIIIGEGELQSKLQRQIETLGLTRDASLQGFDPNPFVYMRHVAAMVLSSDWEGLPTAMIEALACGCPIISTNCRTGPWEILNGGKFGLLVPPGDAGALARAMLEILDNPGDREARVRRGREFDVDNAVNRYLAVAGYA